MIYQEYMTEEAAPLHGKTLALNWLGQAYTTLHIATHGDRRTYAGRKKLISQLRNEGMVPWLNGSGSWMKWGLLDECVFAPWMRNLHWLKAVCGKNKMLAQCLKASHRLKGPFFTKSQVKPLKHKMAPVCSVLSFYFNHDVFCSFGPP